MDSAAHPFPIAVSPNHLDTVDRLGHHAQGVRHPGSEVVVGHKLSGLHPPQHGEQREVKQQHHEGELPRVHGHDDQHGYHLDRVDDPGDGPPLGELGECLDVASDPCGEDPFLGGRVLGEAEPVQVLEGAHPQTQQDILGGPDEPEVGDLPDEDAAHHQRSGHRAQNHRQAQPDPVGGDRHVHHHLDEQGDQQFPSGHRQRHGRGVQGPVAQFGGSRHTPPEHGDRANPVDPPGVHVGHRGPPAIS